MAQTRAEEGNCLCMSLEWHEVRLLEADAEGWKVETAFCASAGTSQSFGAVRGVEKLCRSDHKAEMRSEILGEVKIND